MTGAPTRLVRAALRRYVGPPFHRRGTPESADGLPTLLSVDYRTGEDVVRLVRSYRRFVSPTAPAVVVLNSGLGPRRALRALGVRVVTAGINLHHGLGLDMGMRSVATEYTLICDPDSVIISDKLWPELRRRVDAFGAASIDNGAAYYHPVCLAFRTEIWKRSTLSLQERWPEFDVAAALTPAVGGLREEALLPRTRAAGPPLPSTRQGHVHHYGEVYADAFSNTYCLSRKISEPDRKDFDGWSREELDRFHDRWRAWADGLLTGEVPIARFPTSG